MKAEWGYIGHRQVHVFGWDRPLANVCVDAMRGQFETFLCDERGVCFAQLGVSDTLAGAKQLAEKYYEEKGY